MIIYMATNKVNGKKYIGQTVQTLAARKGAHLRNARNGIKFPFYNAIRKYGEDNFSWVVLCTAGDIGELDAREKYFIAAYGTFAARSKGYNATAGGGNARITLATKKKMSAAKRGRERTAETRAKISATLNGRKLTDEHCAKMGDALRGEKNPKFDPRILAFYHKEHGIKNCTQSALNTEFSLGGKHIYEVVSGKRKSHKGWTMATNLREVG